MKIYFPIILIKWLIIIINEIIPNNNIIVGIMKLSKYFYNYDCSLTGIKV